MLHSKSFQARARGAVEPALTLLGSVKNCRKLSCLEVVPPFFVEENHVRKSNELVRTWANDAS